MILKDFDVNIYYLELNNVKNQPGLDFALWYRIDKIQKKFSKTHESVQALIVKINSEIPGIDTQGMINKLMEAIGDSEKEYSLEKIPFTMLNGVKGNWTVLSALVDIPEEEDKQIEEPK